MKNIYDMHKASFPHVSAFVILHGGEKVATIAFKFSRDGAGRLYAYVHWLGVPMVRGQAGGSGYDKRSAACENAARKITMTMDGADRHAKPVVLTPATMAARDTQTLFMRALAVNGGRYWNDELEAAGFEVLQAV